VKCSLIDTESKVTNDHGPKQDGPKQDGPNRDGPKRRAQMGLKGPNGLGPNGIGGGPKWAGPNRHMTYLNKYLHVSLLCAVHSIVSLL